jgi:23S rRNA pseudouridine2605 synthase
MEERLQKLIAEAGIASRRKAEELIVAGEVTVNGAVVRELGTKADPERDHIKVRGRLINDLIAGRELVYILLNKPRGYLSSTADPENRPLAIDMLPPAIRPKVHTVGRLDFNSEGLLILTNDGKLTDAVARAGRVPKVYQVKVKGSPTGEQIERLRNGVVVDGRRTARASITPLESTNAGNTWFTVVLVEGRNQQIRRMFDAVGHSVVKLRRVQIGAVTDEGLRVGAWRYLTGAEVKKLLAPAESAEPTADAPARSRNRADAPRGLGKPGGPTRRGEGTRGTLKKRTSPKARDQRRKRKG